MKKYNMKAIVFLAMGLVACGGTSPESLVATEDKGASEVLPDAAPNAIAAPNNDSGAPLVDAVGDAGNVQNDSGAIVSDGGADSGLPSCVQDKPVGSCLYDGTPFCREFYQSWANNTTPQYFCSVGTYYEGKGCAELMDAKRPISKCYNSADAICSAMYFYSDVYNTCNGVRY